MVGLTKLCYDFYFCWFSLLFDRVVYFQREVISWSTKHFIILICIVFLFRNGTFSTWPFSKRWSLPLSPWHWYSIGQLFEMPSRKNCNPNIFGFWCFPNTLKTSIIGAMLSSDIIQAEKITLGVLYYRGWTRWSGDNTSKNKLFSWLV